MGHNRLISLPATKNWHQVVALLDDHAPSAEIVASAADAAQRSFSHAVNDPTYTEAVRILVAVAQAGRADNFGPSLTRNELAITSPPTLLELLGTVRERLDEIARTSGNASDIGELAGRALLGTLHEQFQSHLPGLFDESPGDLEAAARHFASPSGFSRLTRNFYKRMTSETLAYWLDRTLSGRVGPDRAFHSIGERNEFAAALDQYSAEATRIIAEFSAGWFAKNALHKESISGANARRYAATAFKKINDELRRKSLSDA